MRIAVHMLVYSREHYGYRFSIFALGTLMLQTHRDWVLYLVDDEGGAFDLEDALAQLRRSGIEVHNEECIKVLPFGCSERTDVIPLKRRHAVAQTSEDLVVIFDDDDYRSPNYLSTVNAAYEASPSLDYNFRSVQLTYDLSRSLYWRPSVHIGSGSWSFRTAWYRAAGVRIEGKPAQKNASDKIFLENLVRTGERHVSRKSIPGLDLQVIVFWHKSNCIPRHMQGPRADKEHVWLRERVDVRLHGLLQMQLELCERAGRHPIEAYVQPRRGVRRLIGALRRVVRRNLGAFLASRTGYVR